MQGVPHADESVCRANRFVQTHCAAGVAMALCHSGTMCSNVVCAYVSARSSSWLAQHVTHAETHEPIYAHMCIHTSNLRMCTCTHA